MLTVIFISHSANAMMPMNSPASAVRMLAEVTLNAIVSMACSVQAIQLSGVQPMSGPAWVICSRMVGRLR